MVLTLILSPNFCKYSVTYETTVWTFLKLDICPQISELVLPRSLFFVICLR